MKRLLFVFVALFFLVYLLCTPFLLPQRIGAATCRILDINVKDGDEKRFVSREDIIRHLQQSGLHPAGRSWQEVNTEQIERELMTNRMLERVEAYRTPSGTVKLVVWQKRPILRVMGVYGDFYVDKNGGLMPVSRRYTAHLPIASGYVSKELAAGHLYAFARFLRRNRFWGGQIEQIYVRADGEVELIPRVGDHRILLGSMDDYETKLDNLRLFYEQAIPKFGWEKYRIINLKYHNQIVCTLR